VFEGGPESALFFWCNRGNHCWTPACFTSGWQEITPAS
jgi:hypothetical protein